MIDTRTTELPIVQPDSDVIEDGRRARRAKNRDAVIDALFDLLGEDHGMPGIEAIAERAGVSVSSVFRYFDGLEDLKHETIERYFARYAELFAIPQIGEGTLADRIDRFVDARIRLYNAIAPIGRLARARAYDQPTIAVPLERARLLFVDHLRTHFSPELDGTRDTDPADLAALIDSLTSFESWDLQHRTHKRSDDDISRGWHVALRALFDADWAGPPQTTRPA